MRHRVDNQLQCMEVGERVDDSKTVVRGNHFGDSEVGARNIARLWGRAHQVRIIQCANAGDDVRSVAIVLELTMQPTNQLMGVTDQLSGNM